MIYQTVIKITRGDIAISYHKNKMTIKERAILIKYGIKIVTHHKLK